MWVFEFMEQWNDVIGFEGIYQVSNFGRLKSNKKILNPCANKKGYLKTTLSKNSIKKQVFIHRIVAEAFLGLVDGKPFINHKNGIKNDNRIENLEWVSNLENQCHKPKKESATSKYIGVYKLKNSRWRVQIGINRKVIYLGSFESEIQAANARIEYEKQNKIINKYLIV